ncbi:MAG: penicillin-binding protein 1C [Saprospiraceae bacterium]|nr:MAG: penicillin-binding protein 1C [Saprospiraceae bacterium]
MKKRLKSIYRFLFHRHPRVSFGVLAILILAYAFCLPRPLFRDPTCVVLEDRKGHLLGAKIAADGQWRFPAQNALPEKFTQAIIEFEDHRFYSHPGVDPISLGRAFLQNIREGKVVSGGSTLTMQVMRMARKNRPRNLWNKLLETIMATRLELAHSKKEILALYAAHAPFGGNVVGLEAATWRYFAKGPALLSWGEAAMLAVLPNSPALIHPGRNRDALAEKRNRLLDRLLAKGVMDSLSWELARTEPLPEQPLPLPRLAPHLLERAQQELLANGKRQESRIKSTLELGLQQQLNEIIIRRGQRLAGNGVYNLAAIVMDVESGEVLAYCGNRPGAGEDHSEAVDIIPAPRSTGSILKPILYALTLQEGTILPNSLLSDVPTLLSGYRPENYYQKYDGAVTARRALIRSLNVPMIYLLQEYGLEKLHFQLKKLGFSTINKPPDYYGLPLILGGAEASLWDLTSTYASMSRTLNHFQNFSGEYDPEDFQQAHYLLPAPSSKPSSDRQLRADPPFLSASAIWFTFDAMQELERPNGQGSWESFASSRRIAWKTGTSFGFRDAWAIGVNPRYAVGVWVGNADGEGRPGLIGVEAAAPVLFDIFNRLENVGGWFNAPYDEMVNIPVCSKSGYRALDICPVNNEWVPTTGLANQACPYHRIIHLDATEKWQVNATCEIPDKMHHLPWFVLPPLEEYYFKSKQPDYRTLPPFRSDCDRGQAEGASMQLIYPKQPTRIYVPIDLNGELSRTVFAIAHRNPETTVYWHIDDEYIGSTQSFHSMQLNPPPGKHTLTLVDEQGRRLVQSFEIIAK